MTDNFPFQTQLDVTPVLESVTRVQKFPALQKSCPLCILFINAAELLDWITSLIMVIFLVSSELTKGKGGYCHVPCSRNWTKGGETTEFCNFNKNNLLMNLKATQTKTKQTKETKKQKESTGGAGLPPQPESRGRLNVPVLSLSAPARPHPTRCHSSAWWTGWWAELADELLCRNSSSHHTIQRVKWGLVDQQQKLHQKLTISAYGIR